MHGRIHIKGEDRGIIKGVMGMVHITGEDRGVM